MNHIHDEGQEYNGETRADSMTDSDYRARAMSDYRDMCLQLDYLNGLIESREAGPDFPWAKYEHLQQGVRSISSRYNPTAKPPANYAHGAPVPFNDDKIQTQGAVEASYSAQLEEVQVNTFNKNLLKKKFKQDEVPNLVSLCKGKDEKQSSEYAAKIDAMWAKVKSETREPDYPAACAAVYKVAESLGLVHKETKARQWRAMLFFQYNVSVTEAISKYQIEKPPASKPFHNAVVSALAYAESSVALLAKRSRLSSIYQ